MKKSAIRWWVYTGAASLGLIGCADPCSDDGLLQDDASECPSVASDGASDTEIAGETEVAEPRCEDGLQNGDETDIDCGGSCPAGCGSGDGCAVDEDCMSMMCGDDGTCQEPPSCDDGVQNGDETDVDCGGSCDAGCDDGEGCVEDDDCMSMDCTDDGICDGGSSCKDGMQNGDETDVDCGNSCGPTCDDGEGCDDNADCISDACDPDTMTCTGGGDPVCDDGMQNGDETDVDCGNSCGPTCEDGEGCDDGADCVSGICDPDSLTCIPPSCDDGVQNGDETDVDCGNSCGGNCDDGEGCDDNADCLSDVCDPDDLTCTPPECDDGVQNGDETDLDCGNSCGATCDDGEDCDDGADCVSGVCDPTDLTCTPPTCDDDVQNGDEEGVDCGGSCPDATCDPVTYCVDMDEDGFGDPDDCVDVPPNEDPPDGSVPNAGDCADDNENAFPGAAEEEPELCAEDEDDDGYGDDDPPPGVDPGSDCSDTDPDAQPGAAANEPELCAIDEDGDGYGDATPPAGVDPGSDCVDTNAGIFPGAAEMEPTLCTADADDDGYGDDSATDIDPAADNGTDCADDNADAFPGSAPNDSPTACLEDEDDDDYGDADPPDGVEPGTDCNDTNPDVPFVVSGIPEDCATAELLDGSLGCEFYGVPLSNDGDPNNPPQYQLLLANANPTTTANVLVEQFVGGAWTTVFGPAAIASGTQVQQELPHISSSTTAITASGSYRVTSDIPIAAYQASISLFTSDASLLIPRASWDTDYAVVGYDGIVPGFDEFVAVAAAEDGTEVTITPTQATSAGGGIPAGTAGTPFTITLDEGESAVVMSPGSNGTSAASLSGTLITSTAPIGVFTGTECSNVPGGVGFCDHLEEMQTPTNTASNTVVASRMPPRDVLVEDLVWQIYAVEDATMTFSALPGVSGIPAGPTNLAAGQSLELSVGGTVAAPGDFVIESDAPIIVSQYLTGASSVTTPISEDTVGDPAHVIMPGASQLLEAYVVGTVEGNVINHLTVTRQVGSDAVLLDGAPIAAADFSTVTPEWEVARLVIDEGTHSLTSAEPFAVLVSGYNDDNSYAYLGGGQARALVCE